MKYRQALGRFGEDLAEKYLLRRGYKIISRNEKISFKEVDIIAERADQVVFVEVKTRASNVYGEADEAFGEKKMENLKTALSGYMLNNDINENRLQIDLIAIDINVKTKTAKIKHYQNVF